VFKRLISDNSEYTRETNSNGDNNKWASHVYSLVDGLLAVSMHLEGPGAGHVYIDFLVEFKILTRAVGEYGPLICKAVKSGESSQYRKKSASVIMVQARINRRR
jgi:hypothetical protein